MGKRFVSLLFFLSPTRILAWLLMARKVKKSTFIYCWNVLFIALAVFVLWEQSENPIRLKELPAETWPFTFQWTENTKHALSWWPALFLLCIPFSRCIEIIGAYLSDAFDKLPKEDSVKDDSFSIKNCCKLEWLFKRDEHLNVSLTLKERLDLMLVCFTELILDFAILFTILPANSWKVGGVEKALSSFEALYYSAVTITTLGYGDITPVGRAARALSMFEVLSGIILLVVSLAIYITYAGKSDPAAD